MHLLCICCYFDCFRYILRDMKIAVRKSEIDGKGVFAVQNLPKRRKIGEMTGELVTIREARRLAKKPRVHIYEFDNQWAMHITNDFRFVNHSCKPNAFVRVVKRQIEVYALRPIEPGDEITVDYGPSTHHDGKLMCKCGCDSRYL
jgi:uncharacterized protein